jgi:hypothetical protein
MTFAFSNVFTVAFQNTPPLLKYLPQSLTVPDGVQQMLVDKVTSRCDALFKQEKHHVDVRRRVLTYRTR